MTSVRHLAAAAGRHGLMSSRTAGRISSSQSPFRSNPRSSVSGPGPAFADRRTFFWGRSSPTSADGPASLIDSSVGSGLIKDQILPTETAAGIAQVATTTDAVADGAPAALSSTAETTSSIVSTVDSSSLAGLGLEYGLFHPAHYAEMLLEQVHLVAGTPWWASIAIATIAVRVALVPITVHSTRTAERMQKSAVLTKPLTDELVRAYVSKDQELIKTKTAELQAFRKSNNLPNPISMFGNVALQAWVGYGGFRLLYDMALLPVPGLDQAGVSWFANIAAADPTYALPVATWAVMSAGMAISRKLLPMQSSVESPQAAMLARMIPLIAGGSSAFFPGTVQIFILVSAVFQSAFSVLMTVPAIRTLFRLTPRQ